MKASKKHIITIAGNPGSGKSTTAKNIAEILGYNHFSSGDLFRLISQEHGHHLLESNLAAEKAEGVSKIDELVDQRLRDIGKSEDSIVIDSRTAWHWIPQSFKVFLDVDLLIASERILSSLSQERTQAEHVHEDPKEYAVKLRERLESEARRYKKVYDIEPYNLENYDLVINTADHNLESVVEQILAAYNRWQNA